MQERQYPFVLSLSKDERILPLRSSKTLNISH